MLNLDEVKKQIITILVKQNRIDDIKAIAIAGGKNNISPTNIEALRVLEEIMGEEYATFYENLKE